MSIAASWLILAVVLLRFLLKKTPKWIIIFLWGIVALRLVVPFSFESAWSLIPSAETFNAHNIQYETPAISSGIPAVNNALNPVLGETFAPNPAGSVNPLYVWTFIETICSSPALSSNPKDYMEEHSIEYQELTYYGRYTLKYCFTRFEEDDETGLAGQIMMQACEDIATNWGEEPLVFYLPMNGVLTGQMWYTAFKNNALSLTEKYTEIELAERYPASYLLLSMFEKV